MKGPPALFHREEGRLASMHAYGFGVSRDDYVEVPVVAFFVEHPTAGTLLIDTGFHGSVAIEPGQAMGRFGGILFKDVEMESNQAVPTQLRGLDVPAESIKTVVMTHLHSDHASGISHFPEATFIISAREWAEARKGRQLDGYIKRQYDHAFDYRLVDFEGPASEVVRELRPRYRPVRRRQRDAGLHARPHPRAHVRGVAPGRRRGAGGR